MATYKKIQTWVKQNYGFAPEICWIADVKSQSGLPMRKESNRKGAAYLHLQLGERPTQLP